MYVQVAILKSVACCDSKLGNRWRETIDFDIVGSTLNCNTPPGFILYSKTYKIYFDFNASVASMNSARIDFL